MKGSVVIHIAYTVALIAISFVTTPQAVAQQRPNIILILADDLGYGDTEPYGQSIIKTPRLTQMAQQGMKFTRAYCGNTVCAPSRCALMTGKHMGHAYVRANDPSDQIPIGDGLPLRPQDTTMAQMLKSAGYRTGMFGKWGLGVQNTSGSPEKKGFDTFFGYLNQVHAHHFFTDSLWRVKDGKLFPERISSNAYTPDLFLYEAKKFIRENKDKPFFVYYSSLLPHAELLIPKKYMGAYTDKSGQSRFLETPFEGQGSYHKQDMPKATFAAMVSKLDADVGALMDLVIDLGLQSNTYILFASDNGAHAEAGHDPSFFNSTAGLRGIKRDLYEGGIRTPLLVWAPGRVQEGTETDAQVAFWDLMPTFAAWAKPKKAPHSDGISLASLLLNPQNSLPKRVFYWENHIKWKSLFAQAVLSDNWKLVRIFNKNAVPVLELYNLNDDPFETENVAAKYPDKCGELLEHMRALSMQPEHPDLVYWKDQEQLQSK